MRACVGAFAVVATMTSFGVVAEERPTYDKLWQQISENSGCTRTEQPDFTMFTCNADRALWYFTKPNNPAHPGVIKRAVVQDGNGVLIQSSGWSFGSDADQPKFQAWLDQFKALDARVRADMQRRAQQTK